MGVSTEAFEKAFSAGPHEKPIKLVGDACGKGMGRVGVALRKLIPGDVVD